VSDTPRTDAIPHDWASLAMHSRQLERELTALRSQQMTEDKARLVLGAIAVDGIYERNQIDISVPLGEDVRWAGSNIAGINGEFTAEELRAIAWWMDNKGGKNNGSK